MASINHGDWGVFLEAGRTILDNFTDAEVAEMAGMAKRLNTIMESAKERQQESLAAYEGR